MKRDNFFIQLLKCYLNLFFGFIMCFMLSMTIMVFNGYTLITIIIQIFCLAIILLLLGNYAWKDGKNEIKLTQTYGLSPVSPFRWWGLGLMTALPYEILCGLLILSKLNIWVPQEFGTAYKILADVFLPLTAMFAKPAAAVSETATSVAHSSDYPWWLIAVLGILPLLIPVTMAITHKVSFSDKVSADTVVYKDIKK